MINLFSNKNDNNNKNKDNISSYLQQKQAKQQINYQ